MITGIADQSKRTVEETFDWLSSLWTNEVVEMMDE